jgi:uncharacterized protein YdiU (UPF0061 family)
MDAKDKKVVTELFKILTAIKVEFDDFRAKLANAINDDISSEDLAEVLDNFSEDETIGWYEVELINLIRDYLGIDSIERHL